MQNINHCLSSKTSIQGFFLQEGVNSGTVCIFVILVVSYVDVLYESLLLNW